ncbi:MAG: S-layer homology domain-containing protein [Chloroflexi bacterium]|nr:S-layer homology domain-containing protein [Chloroflexota bacterium]
MKHRTHLILSILAVALLLTVFSAGRASASTGCFNDTNGNWAETFICWMKDNGITGGYPDGGYHPNSSVTRAEMAVFMRALRTTGDTYINAGPSNWVPNGTGNHYITYYPYAAILKNTTAGGAWFNAMPSIPSSILNAKMYFKGVKVCYEATHGASISNIEVRHYGSSGNVLNEVTSTTTRTDSSCVTLNFTSAVSLWGGEWGSVAVLVNFPSAAEYVYIRGITFILSPSADPAILGPATGLRPDVEVPAIISSGSENP